MDGRVDATVARRGGRVPVAVRFGESGIEVRSPAAFAAARELWRVRRAIRLARVPRASVPVRLRLGRLPAFTLTV